MSTGVIQKSSENILSFLPTTFTLPELIDGIIKLKLLHAQYAARWLDEACDLANAKDHHFESGVRMIIEGKHLELSGEEKVQWLI